MGPLAARELLQVWEWGERQHPIDRALALLALTCPEMAWEELIGLSVGRRDAHLLMLRRLTFGSQLDGYANCPECQERLMFALDATEMCSPEALGPKESERRLAVAGFKVQFRLPNSLDLAAIVHCPNVQVAHDVLVQRCVLQAHQDEVEVAANTLPQTVVETLAKDILEYDPLSEVRLNFQCPACEHQWSVLLDIVSFFWSEITAQAKRLLQEVCLLAQAFGWREVDILDMSAKRRQFYLEMAA